jgi:hypothetical protein
MAPRCRALASEKMYKNLIKLHLNAQRHTSSLNWNTTDLAVVTVHHERFLCEVARTGCSIHVAMLTKCLHEHLNSGCSRDFAQKLADALAFCKAKGKPSRTSMSKRLLRGKITSKTASAVKAVISAIKGSILASSEEGEAVEDLDAPSSPLLLEEEDAPGDMVAGDAAAALQRLQEPFDKRARAQQQLAAAPVQMHDGARLSNVCGFFQI